jgi:glycosyltransferase involved in cell wall biosynthesis
MHRSEALELPKPSLFTVVIPTHNRIEMLRNAIRSVLNQTHTHFECLIISDYPLEHDKVAQAIRDFRDPRLRFIPSSKPGANASRNMGVLNAQGDYIAYLDDDDEWLPHKLQDHATAHLSADFVYSNTVYQYHASPPYYAIRTTRPAHQNLLERLKNIQGPATSSCVSVCKSHATSHLWDESLQAYQDWDTWFRIIRGGARSSYIHIPNTIFNHHIAPRITSGFERRLDALIQIYNKYHDLVNPASLNTQARTIFISDIPHIKRTQGIRAVFQMLRSHRNILAPNWIFYLSVLKKLAAPEKNYYTLSALAHFAKRLLGKPYSHIVKEIPTPISSLFVKDQSHSAN